MAYAYGGGESFERRLKSRVFWITAFILIGFFAIVVRLWYLQVVQGFNLRALAESNRLRQVTLSDYRGRIYDRNGIELVSSRPSFDVVLIREDIADLDEILKKLSTLIPVKFAAAKKSILSVPSFTPFIVAYDISRNDAAKIEERRYELPGVSLSVRGVRNYRYDSFAAHLLGYLGEISKKQMNQPMYEDYQQGDIIGKYGVEKSFEPLLRGTKGKKIIEVDAAGRELQIIKSHEAGSGQDIYLSLDYNAQTTAEKAMEGKRGAVVAMKPQTGEILAMASSPAFDPNKFALGVESAYWKTLVTDEYHPLNNRAIQGQYAPGSTYKIIMAAAALSEGVIDANTSFTCPGYYKLGRKVYRCWKKGGHGQIKLERALAQSCDVFFYQTGLKLGVDKIAEYAKRFGLNNITGVSLDHEKRGLVPTTEWKVENRNEPWIAGETLSVSIGQGFNLVTPIQMAGVISSIANGGWVPVPSLIKLAEDTEADPDVLGGRFTGISKANMDSIRSGLYKVVNEPGGTGGWARIKGVEVAGKTGTSQVVRLKEMDETEEEEIPEKFRDHAWFVAYAPFDSPEIAVAVVVEHGGHGGSVAAPVAQQVIKSYLDGLAERK